VLNNKVNEFNTNEYQRGCCWGFINDKSLNGFNEILTLAVDNRQSIACQWVSHTISMNKKGKGNLYVSLHTMSLEHLLPWNFKQG
jgi:hypothetical protein